MPGITAPAGVSKYDQIPGPLGPQSNSLEGKVALVTGAGRGIGKEMALELARRGAKIIVNYANSTEAAEQVVAAIKKAGSDAVSIKANVGVVDEIVSLFEQAVKAFGKLDIVCSNSGVVSFGHVKDVTPEEFDRVFNINTRGQFFVAREAYKHLEVGGRLILMGSITGQAKGVPKHAVYSGSKGTIETFVRCMAIAPGVPCIAGISPTQLRRTHAREQSSAPTSCNLAASCWCQICLPKWSEPIADDPFPFPLQTLATRRSRSTPSRPAASRPTCTTPSAGNTSPTAPSWTTRASTSSPPAGRPCTASASPSISPASSASWPRRTASGSTARSWALTAAPACKTIKIKKIDEGA
ncbi:hypothetical protein RB593_010191 [Gaeumannomyces tritici]